MVQTTQNVRAMTFTLSGFDHWTFQVVFYGGLLVLEAMQDDLRICCAQSNGRHPEPRPSVDFTPELRPDQFTTFSVRIPDALTQRASASISARLGMQIQPVPG